VLQEGIAGTKVFGMRLMWRDFANLSNRLAVFYPGLQTNLSRFEATFGPTKFVHLSRKDKVAQAVSRIKAEQSGLWHVDENGKERERLKPSQTPIYDAGVISGQVAECEVHDAAWVN
jgi:trehalose 2-sulfotransferase